MFSWQQLLISNLLHFIFTIIPNTWMLPQLIKCWKYFRLFVSNLQILDVWSDFQSLIIEMRIEKRSFIIYNKLLMIFIPGSSSPSKNFLPNPMNSPYVLMRNCEDCEDQTTRSSTRRRIPRRKCVPRGRDLNDNKFLLNSKQHLTNLLIFFHQQNFYPYSSDI